MGERPLSSPPAPRNIHQAMSKRKWDQTGDPSDDPPSKISKTEDGKSASEAAAVAVRTQFPGLPVFTRMFQSILRWIKAAIAAKIAAQFSAGSSSSTVNKTPSSLAANGATVVTDDKRKDPHDAEFTCDIEINDVRNRYMLTKGATQQDVSYCPYFYAYRLIFL